MYSDKLSSIELFRGLSRADLRLLSQRMRLLRLPAQTLVIREGEATDSLYCIVRGLVRVFVGKEGGREVSLCTLGDGDHFGEIALLDGQGHSASVICVEPSELAVLDGADFHAFLAAEPERTGVLLRSLAQRLRRLTRQTRDLATLDVYGRIARMLLDASQPENGERVIREKMTHQRIAQYVGCSREMVSRIMKDLHAGGYVRSAGGRLVISESLPRAW